VDQILAWRGQNGTNSSTSGSSDDYEALPRPYRLKGAPFDSVDELLLVQGVTPLLLYGPEDGTVNQSQPPWADLLFVDTTSPNTNRNGGRRTPLTANALRSASRGAMSQMQAQNLARSTSWASLFSQAGQSLSPAAIKNLVDQYSLPNSSGTQLMGKVNINTATEQVLETLPGMTADTADQIVQRRQSSGDFQTVGDLMDVGQAIFRSLVDRVTTKSSVFIVRAMGELPNGTVRAVEAWVRGSGQNLQVIRWRVVPRTPGWYDWGWDNGAGRNTPAASVTPRA
jgi:DNA uptake protein ComE-like DNA-binding protein